MIQFANGQNKFFDFVLIPAEEMLKKLLRSKERKLLKIDSMKTGLDCSLLATHT